MAKDCKRPVKCTECQSDRHLAALHVTKAAKPKDQGKEGEEDKKRDGAQEEGQQHGGESERITTTCTEICGNKHGGRSCSKICLANVYTKVNLDKKIKAYVVIDDQSNRSLARSKLFELLDINGETFPYTLRTCAGTTQAEGRQAKDLVIESLDGLKQYLLPTVTECNAIPDNKDEIPTPDVAASHPHLRPIADLIPALERDVDILLLIGRDAPPLHKVRESRNGKGNAPWGQRLDLGWVILGNACLNGVHAPSDHSSFKTHILHNGRPSTFEPCSNLFHVDRTLNVHEDRHGDVGTSGRKESFAQGRFEDGIANNVFVRTRYDNTPGLSVEDRKFIDMMENKHEEE